MVDNKIWEFIGDDEAYLTWTKAHPNGFVLNTYRSPSASYLILHKAGCPTITEYKGDAKPGGFTEREFIKICSDLEDSIKSWGRRKGFSSSLITKECYCWKDDWW